MVLIFWYEDNKQNKSKRYRMADGDGYKKIRNKIKQEMRKRSTGTIRSSVAILERVPREAS